MGILDYLKPAAGQSVATQYKAPTNIPTLGPSNPGASTAEEINKTLTTTPATSTTPKTTVAPYFDSEYEHAVNSINKQLAGLTASKETATRRVGEDYTTAVGDASKQNVRSLDALQERLANQGIRNSGINVGEQGKLFEALQEHIGKLTTSKTRSLEDIASDYANKQAGYQDQLSQAEIAKANRQTEREKEAAAVQAQAEAARATADQQRQWISELTASLTSLAQPQPSPTGQMQPAPPPQQIVQKAIAQVPPPAVRTPQQQAAELGIDARQLQAMLAQRGFSPGPIDGVMGIKTQQALARWKQSIGLPATADLTREIWTQLSSMATPVSEGARGTYRPGAIL